MSTSVGWRLKRYGRLVPTPGETRASPWKIFESRGKKADIFITIVEAGYLLVLQGKECLDTVPLLCGSDSLKVHRRSDNLMFRFTVKGEGRMMRMQFDGNSRAQAAEVCLTVVEKLKEYIPVTQDDTLPAPVKSPAEGTAPEMQEQTHQGQAAGATPEVVQGSLSIKCLTQHFLGEAAVTLPEVYRHSFLTQGDLGPILRVCLLDPSFHAFVEKVEGELRKMLEQ